MKRSSPPHKLVLLALMAAMWNSTPAQAIIVFSEQGPLQQSTNPGDGSGWDLHGFLGQTTLIPISPHYGINAAHFGTFGPGDTVSFDQGPNDGSYTIASEAFLDSEAGTDLRLFRIEESFEAWAPLFTGDSEVGMDLTVFGRGRRAGEEVFVNGHLKGWKWGSFASGRPLSWGRNTVADLTESDTLLSFSFNAESGQGIGAEGDSGGGVFVSDQDQWKLAGINLAVDGPFGFSNDDPDFNAALFDRGGLWQGPQGNRTFIRNRGVDQPARTFSTRISPRFDWIRSVVMTGDLTNDGRIGLDDIHLLQQVIRDGDGEWFYDFTDDGAVGDDDLAYYIEQIANTVFGDATLSGSVGLRDASVLLSNFGREGTFYWGDGDFNNDGVVDGKDLRILLDNWSGSLPPPENLVAMTSTAIPEPATVPLLLAAAAGLMLRRRRDNFADCVRVQRLIHARAEQS